MQFILHTSIQIDIVKPHSSSCSFFLPFFSVFFYKVAKRKWKPEIHSSKQTQSYMTCLESFMCVAFLTLDSCVCEWWPEVAEMTSCHWGCGIDQSCPKVVGGRKVACSMWYDENAERARIPATCTVQGQQVEAWGGEFKKKKKLWMMNGPTVLSQHLCWSYCISLHCFIKRGLPYLSYLNNSFQFFSFNEKSLQPSFL